MKILIDPIYSAKPSHCASALKAKRIVEDVLSKTDTVFFRWLIPDWDLPQEEMDWFPEHPNIEYVLYPYSKDRMKEYQALHKDLEEMIAFNGKYWDTDMLITMRTQQVPSMRIVMTSPRNYNQAYMKRVVVYEEMPVMSFKKTVAVSDRYVQDVATLAGYLSSDDVFITVKHEKDGIMQAAKKYLSPAMVMALKSKIKLYTPIDIASMGFHEKAKESRFVRKKRPFCIGFTERMGNSTTNLDNIYSMMVNHWILKGDKGFKAVFSTVSTGIKNPPPEFCEVVHPPREEFWRLLREEMDVVVTMTVEGGFSMSTVEPILFGVPSIAKRATWLESLFGEDYPFFVDNELQAYAMVKMFHDDYETMYAKFHEWQQTTFKARFSAGGVYEHTLYELVWKNILLYQNNLSHDYRAEFPKKSENEIVKAVVNKVKGRKEFVLHDVLRELADDGVFRGMEQKLEDTRDTKGLVWSTPWNEFRLALLNFHGWADASTEVGHFRRA